LKAYHGHRQHDPFKQTFLRIERKKYDFFCLLHNIFQVHQVPRWHRAKLPPRNQTCDSAGIFLLKRKHIAFNILLLRNAVILFKLMKITNFRFFFVAIIYLFCSAVTCGKKDFGPSYNFTENIDLYPEQEIYHIGDTIWMQHQNPTHILYDKSYNLHFLADTLSMPFYFACTTVYNLPPDTTNTFCNFIINGVNTGPYFSLKMLGCNSPDSFNFKIGMLLNKTGTFSIELITNKPVYACNFTNPYIAGQQFPPSSISYSFTYTNGHKDIFLGVTPERRADDKEYVYESLKNKTMYFFKVE
jgi:hypothetical protein